MVCVHSTLSFQERPLKQHNPSHRCTLSEGTDHRHDRPKQLRDNFGFTREALQHLFRQSELLAEICAILLILGQSHGHRCSTCKPFRSSGFLIVHHPRLSMGHLSWNVGIMEHGNLWKSSRRLFHEFLNARAVTNFDRYQRKHAYRFLLHLTESPNDFLDHTELWVFPCDRFVKIPILYVCWKCGCGARHGDDVRVEHREQRRSIPASSNGSSRGHNKGHGSRSVPR